MATGNVEKNVYMTGRLGFGSLDPVSDEKAVTRGLRNNISNFPKGAPFLIQCTSGGVYSGIGFVYEDGSGNAFFNLSKVNGSRLFVKYDGTNWSYAFTAAPTFTPVTD